MKQTALLILFLLVSLCGCAIHDGCLVDSGGTCCNSPVLEIRALLHDSNEWTAVIRHLIYQKSHAGFCVRSELCATPTFTWDDARPQKVLRFECRITQFDYDRIISLVNGRRTYQKASDSPALVCLYLDCLSDSNIMDQIEVVLSHYRSSES